MVCSVQLVTNACPAFAETTTAALPKGIGNIYAWHVFFFARLVCFLSGAFSKVGT